MITNGTGRMFHYWGKAAQRDDPSKHLLVYHLLDVCAVGAILLDRDPTLLGRFARMTGLDEDRILRWLLWLLGHHDIGKFAAAFQRLRADLFPEPLSDRYRYSERHDTLGYQLWLHSLLEIAFPWLSGRYDLEEAILILLRTTSGHHGKPPKSVEWRSTWYRQEDVAAARDLSRNLSRLFFDSPHPQEIRTVDERAFLGRIAMASWALAGFAVLCDWLGSNRVWFPFVDEPMDLETYWESHALRQAGRAVAEAALLPSPAATRTGFVVLFECLAEPTALQRVADSAPVSSGPQLFIVEDLTGSGKTEAALTLAGRLLTEGAAEGLYVALPTTATADAMYSRVGAVYRRLFDPGTRPSLVLAHSRRDLSKQFRASVGGERIEPEAAYDEDEAGAAATCASWLADNRKKALLAQVGVGTVDQALLAILNVRHQSLRALGLLGKLLIVDEVHACDAYVNRLLQHLLQLHAAMGGSAILLSATLVLQTRHDLVHAFAAGAGFDPPEVLPDHYPQLLAVSNHGSWSRAAEAPYWSRRTLRFQFLHDAATAPDWVAEQAHTGACVCWVRNTVADAIQAFDSLAERLGVERVMLFHARFALGDRLRIEAAVQRQFGKGSTAKQRRGRVVVATQVIEQSLDLDFDEMLTDLAPIDLLLQRGGRLRRHCRDERGNPVAGPDRRGDAVLHVLTPVAVDDPPQGWIRSFLPGTAAVYPHHGQLWRTTRLLADSLALVLPDSLRDAIETVFSETSGNPPPDGLQKSSLVVEGQWRADASLGDLNAIALEQGYGGCWGGWTDIEDARTRLGEPTVTLCLARWEHGNLMPWAADGSSPWALSEVVVRRSQVADLVLPDDPGLESAMTALEERQPTREAGRLLVPLVEQEDGSWACMMSGQERQPRVVRYRSTRGLEVTA